MDHLVRTTAAARDEPASRMKGCAICCAIWAPARAPASCPECQQPPAAMDMVEIRSLIRRRQDRFRARYPGVPFRPRVR